MIESLPANNVVNANEAAGALSTTHEANAAQPTTVAAQSNGLGYCWGAVAFLVVGFFAFAVPCGFIAYSLSKEAIKRGATNFGTIMKWISAAYVGLMILGIFLV
jgi:hypothetical protein